MLIARFFKVLRGWNTPHVFLLEILAVFIGITASLFIDDWRERRQDQEILDHLLQATHYNALQDHSYALRVLGAEQSSLQDTLTLAYEDVDLVADADLVRIFSGATADSRIPDVQPGYQRLLNTSLSIPFDHTMAELDYAFRQIQQESDSVAELQRRILDLDFRILAAARMPDDTRDWSMDLVDEAATRFDEIIDVLAASSGYQANIGDAAAIRAALRDPAVQSMLRELIGLRERSTISLIRYAAYNEDVIQSIRRYDPGIPAPVGNLELSGSATPVGWSGGLPMRLDTGEPNIWRLRVTLTAGDVKFRADNSFASNWGAPDLPENRADNVGFEFDGDPAAVFPRGIAEFGGLNIPVAAGTYDVTFNSQTLEYSFERVSSQSPE